MAYLETARFVAERILPLSKPETQTWDFDGKYFHGSKNFATGGGGDYLEDDEYVLTGFRPYRSNLHLSIDPEEHDQFAIPAFGKYRLEVSVRSDQSKEGRSSVSTLEMAAIQQASKRLKESLCHMEPIILKLNSP